MMDVAGPTPNRGLYSSDISGASFSVSGYSKSSVLPCSTGTPRVSGYTITV